MVKSVPINGTDVYYQLRGKGNPVVLIHGFGEDGNIWERQLQYLESQMELIVPDLPGSGQSPLGKEDWTIDSLAGVIKSILDHEKIKKTVLVGHSMGGYITMGFAEKYPQYLAAYGLFHSSAFADNEEKKATRRKGIEFIRQNGAFAFLKTMIPGLFSDYTKKNEPGLVKNHFDKQNNFSAASLVNYYEAMIKRPDRRHILAKAEIPVLFIAGKYDNAVPVEDVLKQSHLPGNAYIHILRNSGHMGMLEETDNSNISMKNFLLEVQY